MRLVLVLIAVVLLAIAGGVGFLMVWEPPPPVGDIQVEVPLDRALR